MRLHAFAACAWVLLAQSCTCPWDLPESCPNQVHQKDEHSWKVKPALKCRWRKAVWRHPTSDISTQILFHLEKGRVSVGLTGVDWLRTICRYLFWSFFLQLHLMFPTWRAMWSWKKILCGYVWCVHWRVEGLVVLAPRPKIPVRSFSGMPVSSGSQLKNQDARKQIRTISNEMTHK